MLKYSYTTDGINTLLRVVVVTQSADDYVTMTYEFYQRPDAVFIIPGQDEDVANSSEPVTYADNLHGDFYIEPIDESEDTNNTYTVQTISESLMHGGAA